MQAPENHAVIPQHVTLVSPYVGHARGLAMLCDSLGFSWEWIWSESGLCAFVDDYPGSTIIVVDGYLAIRHGDQFMHWCQRADRDRVLVLAAFWPLDMPPVKLTLLELLPLALAELAPGR